MRIIDVDKIPVIFEPVAYSNDCSIALDRETIEELVKHCSVDAVPVVRCKDCKWHEREQLGMVYCPSTVVGWVEDNWFCKGGERKDDETD